MTAKTNIITNLDNEFKNIFPKAKAIYIAVALSSSYALELLKLANPKANIKIITGVDLPTPLKVLTALRKAYSNNVKIFRKKFFHPKMYLFEIGNNKFVAYISSGNFTTGGAKDNIEIGVRITNSVDCQYMKEWFLKMFDDSELISDAFLESYQDYQNKWIKSKREMDDEFKILQTNFKVNSEALKTDLRKLKQSSNYLQICKERNLVIDDLKRCLDYNNNFSNIDINTFLNIYELGKIRLTYRKDLYKSVKNKTFQKLIKMLCDESKDIEDRFILAQNEYHIRGAGKNIITKILVMHNPNKYILWNNVTDEFIKKYNFTFEGHLNNGQKYVQLCQYFKYLCDEVAIENFAILDELLYQAMK